VSLVERASQLVELKIEIHRGELEAVCACYCLESLNELRSAILQFPNTTLQLPSLIDLLAHTPDAATFAKDHPDCAFTLDSESCHAHLVHPHLLFRLHYALYYKGT
jgi:hypothetical protein